MISGPLSSLPPDLESRLAAARQKTPLSSSGYSSASPRQRPSDIMVAAVNARNSGAKTPGQAQTVVTRPTSAVKPTNVPSKVDSGLVRAGPGRTPVMRQQRSHSPARGQQRSHSPGPAASAASAPRTRGQQPRSQSPGGGGRSQPRSQ